MRRLVARHPNWVGVALGFGCVSVARLVALVIPYDWALILIFGLAAGILLGALADEINR